MNGYQFSLATTADLESVRHLLKACDLPDQDIAQHLPNFILAKKENRLVGVVGLESLSNLGLLRSLAVANSHRGKGLAKTLYKKITRQAQDQGIEQLYLLTLTAEGFFSKMGFTTINRTVAPDVIQATEEFKSLCPDTAVCMVKQIKG